MAEETRSVLKGWFQTGDKPTQAQFESLIDSLFSLADDGGAKVKYLLEQLANLNRLKKTAVRGADFALNRRGAIKWDLGANQITMTNILPGDFWVYAKGGAPAEGDPYYDGDILVLLTDTPGDAPWTLTDTSKFWIIRASKIDDGVTMTDEDTGSVMANNIAVFKADSESKLMCSDFSISDVWEAVKMTSGDVTEISATELLMCAGDETRYIAGSGKRIDDSAGKGTAILWTSNKFGDAALKNTGTTAGTVCAGDDSRIGTFADGTVTAAKLHESLTKRYTMASVGLDWSHSAIYLLTLTGATTLNFSNLVLNKVVTLLVSGNYSFAVPGICKKISGTYSASAMNYIQFHCTNATSGSEEVWYSISQQI